MLILRYADPLKAPKREYVPVDTTQRFLVVVWDRSKIEKVLLPPTVAVASNSTSVGMSSGSTPVPSATNGLSITDLRTILRTTLGAQCDLADKVANVFGAQISSPPGGSEFRKVLFEYSCVISVCSKRKHHLAQGSRPPDTLIELWDTKLPQPGGGLSSGSNLWSNNGVTYDIDIHTADAPIVCVDPQMQLGALHLDECTVGGVVNLFVTVRRQAGDHSPDDGSCDNWEGMDAMFMDRKCWVSVDFQTLYNCEDSTVLCSPLTFINGHRVSLSLRLSAAWRHSFPPPVYLPHESQKQICRLKTQYSHSLCI